MYMYNPILMHVCRETYIICMYMYSSQYYLQSHHLVTMYIMMCTMYNAHFYSRLELNRETGGTTMS